MDKVAIVHTGTSNVASVVAALTRAGVTSEIVMDRKSLLAANRIVIPGVGAFGAAMETLRKYDLAETLTKKLREGTPALAICLGMQILFDSSEESPGVQGLGIFRGHIRKFRAGIRVPHLGWNEVKPVRDQVSERWLQSGHAYFAHSFLYPWDDSSDNFATTEYTEHFVSAIETENILACQFHPELSGAWGAALIGRWLGREDINTNPLITAKEEAIKC